MQQRFQLSDKALASCSLKKRFGELGLCSEGQFLPVGNQAILHSAHRPLRQRESMSP